MPDSMLMGSLKTLSTLLKKHYDKRVIILIDEYDVPLAKANAINRITACLKPGSDIFLIS